MKGRLATLLAVILTAAITGGGVAAQQVSGVPHVGLLHWPRPEMGRLAAGEFREGMRSLGWIEGSTISIEDRFADGNAARLSANAAEFVAAKVHVIVAIDSAPAGAARQATSAIPIVMTSGDPVGLGLVASLARPGGNVTGLSAISPDLADVVLYVSAAGHAPVASAVFSFGSGRVAGSDLLRNLLPM